MSRSEPKESSPGSGPGSKTLGNTGSDSQFAFAKINDPKCPDKERLKICCHYQRRHRSKSADCLAEFLRP